MRWLKVEHEGYYPAWECSDCGHMIVMEDECLELPKFCEKCKEPEQGKSCRYCNGKAQWNSDMCARCYYIYPKVCELVKVCKDLKKEVEFKMIDYSKCQSVYEKLKLQHRIPINIGGSVWCTAWATSALDLNRILFDMYAEEKITGQEMTYIFGMICNDALFCNYNENFFK